MMPVNKFCGLNFSAIEDKADRRVDEFQGNNIHKFNLIVISNVFIDIPNNFNKISSGPYFLIKINGNEFELSLLNEEKKRKEKLDHEIKEFVISYEMVYFLLNNSKIMSYNYKSQKFTEIISPLNLSHLSCTSSSLYAIVNSHIVHRLSPTSSLIHEFPSHQKIKKICSGLEHLIILTTNGDLYSFGCGLRGQLGHGDVRNYDKPKLIDALAGIKIIDIACGAFHSVAISSFGDLYSFGWNTNGQLGLKKALHESFSTSEIKCQQVYTIPQLIEFEDENESFVNVYCGNKHTILKTETGRLYAAGLNNYGQLGCGGSIFKDIDKFTEIPIIIEKCSFNVNCGYWATYITH